MKNVKVNPLLETLKLSLALSQSPSAKKALERALENEAYTKEYFAAKARLQSQSDVLVYHPEEVAKEAGWA